MNPNHERNYHVDVEKKSREWFATVEGALRQAASNVYLSADGFEIGKALLMAGSPFQFSYGFTTVSIGCADPEGPCNAQTKIIAGASDHVEQEPMLNAQAGACQTTTLDPTVTQDWLRRYAYGDAECPRCGGELEGREVTIEEDQASQDCNCVLCGFSFSALYEFKGIVPSVTVDIPGEAIYLEDRA